MAVQTISYANKSAINTNPEIADTNKVNDTDMNEIKSVVNNNALELSTCLDGLVYSINETDTGKIWIDNKPIYRKVLYTPTTTGIPSDFSLDITNLDSITYIDVLLIQTRSAGGYQYKKSYYQGDNDNWRWWLNDERENNRQVMKFAGSLSSLSSTNRKCQITVEYTKTTD